MKQIQKKILASNAFSLLILIISLGNIHISWDEMIELQKNKIFRLRVFYSIITIFLSWMINAALDPRSYLNPEILNGKYFDINEVGRVVSKSGMLSFFALGLAITLITLIVLAIIWREPLPSARNEKQ